MKALWSMLAAHYDKLAPRERWMTAVATLGGIALAVVLLLLDPAMQSLQLAERGLADQRTQLTNVRAQILALQNNAQDPEAAAHSELDKLNHQLGEFDTRLVAMGDTLVPPENMTPLLEDLIGRNSGLRLLGLRTLPVTPVVEKKPLAASGDDAKMGTARGGLATSSGLFKHGVEIKLEGSYQNLAAYLARLEKAPAKLLWSSVALSAEQYPKLVLTLTVFTLSLDRTWLVI